MKINKVAYFDTTVFFQKFRLDVDNYATSATINIILIKKENKLLEYFLGSFEKKVLRYDKRNSIRIQELKIIYFLDIIFIMIVNKTTSL